MSAAHDLGDRDLEGAYTTAEVAALLDVSVPTVKRLIRGGELETYRVRQRVFIPRRALRQAMATPPKPHGEPLTEPRG